MIFIVLLLYIIAFHMIYDIMYITTTYIIYLCKLCIASRSSFIKLTGSYRWHLVPLSLGRALAARGDAHAHRRGGAPGANLDVGIYHH